MVVDLKFKRGLPYKWVLIKKIVWNVIPGNIVILIDLEHIFVKMALVMTAKVYKSAANSKWRSKHYGVIECGCTKVTKLHINDRFIIVSFKGEKKKREIQHCKEDN